MRGVVYVVDFSSMGQTMKVPYIIIDVASSFCLALSHQPECSSNFTKMLIRTSQVSYSLKFLQYPLPRQEKRAWPIFKVRRLHINSLGAW